jgi:hypothetical protein
MCENLLLTTEGVQDITLAYMPSSLCSECSQVFRSTDVYLYMALARYS